MTTPVSTLIALIWNYHVNSEAIERQAPDTMRQDNMFNATSRLLHQFGTPMHSRHTGAQAKPLLSLSFFSL